MKTSSRQTDIQLPKRQHELADGLKRLQITLGRQQQELLLEYLLLLAKWNKVFNLTAIRDPEEMVSRQLLDSLSILPWVRGARVLDVGTGAGLPGLPLAIACPDIHFTLLDSNGKKTRFVQQAVAQLGLDNVEVVNERIERFQDPRGFEVITSRAFASLVDFFASTGHLLAPGGRWLAMKGLADKEQDKLPGDLRYQLHPLVIPGCEGERHLVEAERSA